MEELDRKKQDLEAQQAHLAKESSRLQKEAQMLREHASADAVLLAECGIPGGMAPEQVIRDKAQELFDQKNKLAELRQTVLQEAHDVETQKARVQADKEQLAQMKQSAEQAHQQYVLENAQFKQRPEIRANETKREIEGVQELENTLRKRQAEQDIKLQQLAEQDQRLDAEMAKLVERNQQLQAAQTNLQQQHDVALALQRSLLGVQAEQKQQDHIEAQLDAALHNAHYCTPKTTMRAPATPTATSAAQAGGPPLPPPEEEPQQPSSPPPKTSSSLTTTVPMGHQSPAIDLLTPAPAHSRDSGTDQPQDNDNTRQLAAQDAEDQARDAAIRAQETAHPLANGRNDLSDSDSFDVENDFRLAAALQAKQQPPTAEWVTQAAAIHLPDADAGIETDHEGFTSSSAGPDIPPPNKVHKGRATEPFPKARRASSTGKPRPKVGLPGPEAPPGSP